MLYNHVGLPHISAIISVMFAGLVSIECLHLTTLYRIIDIPPYDITYYTYICYNNILYTHNEVLQRGCIAHVLCSNN